jgi:hypothetical protein
MIEMPPEMPVFEALLEKRGRAWRWRVCTAEGRVVMAGTERRRISARYEANRALFLMLLCAPYASIHPGANDGRRRSHSDRSRSNTKST